METQNNTSLAQLSYYSASLQSNLHTAGLQAQFFKKSPFDDLQLQNGRHRNNLVAEIVTSIGGHFILRYRRFYGC